METRSLKRKAFFVDESEIEEARKLLGVKTDAEAVRESISTFARMHRFWRLMDRSRGSLPPGSFTHE